MTTYVAAMRAAVEAELSDYPAELIDLYTLQARKRSIGAFDLHDAWLVWASRDRPDHPLLVEYDQLTAEVAALDQSYVDAILRAVRAVRLD